MPKERLSPRKIYFSEKHNSGKTCLQKMYNIFIDITFVYGPRQANLVIRDFNGHLPYPFQNPISNFYLSLEAGKSSTDSVILRKLTNVEIVFRAWTKSLKRTKLYFDD